MDAHERLIKALEFDEPDRVPTLTQYFDYPFTKKVVDRMSIDDKPNNPLSKHVMYDAALYMGFDSIWYHYDRIRIIKSIASAINSPVAYLGCWFRYFKYMQI